MVKEYELDTEDEKIIDELDNLCGVIQNKQVLKNMITYARLREKEKIDFGNFNLIIRNNSSYNMVDDLLKICKKIFLKYNIIQNDKICYLDRITNGRRNNPLDKIIGIESDVIVINERKLGIDLEDELENVTRILNTYPNKVFVFEDTNWRDGELDAKLGELVSWRLTIEKISLEDKIIYCKNQLEQNNLKYKNQNLKEFADQPMWMLQKQLMQLVVECKSKDITKVPEEMFRKNKEKSKENTAQRKSRIKDKDNKNAQQDMEDLIGLEDIKTQVQKILNYVKFNKNRGKMPCLHMLFNGNPGTGKTSIARIIGKLFEEENILTGCGGFVEIHGRDLVDQYVGWTAPKVKGIINDAIGGVLFIDEAYSLVSSRRGSFEDEAIATLIKEMEDHRDEICIILAGYTEEMKNLINLNPGFESRIQFTIDFPDYSEEELYSIINGLCKKEKYKLPQNSKEVLIDIFKNAKKQEGFGNGRYARNLFEKIKFEQADRVMSTNSKNTNSITIKDISNALNNMKTINTETHRKIGFN